MKYFFVLGRNPELSKAELFLYLEARNIDFSEIFFQDNLVILDLEKEFNFNINNFGGLIGLGKLQEFLNENEFEKFLNENEFVEKDKFTYTILGSWDSEIFSEKFKKERKKAQIKNFGKRLKLQSGEFTFIPKVDVEIFVEKINSKIYLGLVQQKFSSQEVEERDMGKPIRRESLAISPRLAKILINLAQVKQKDTILDPFCGVGGIIQEALLQEINCIGIDKDLDAINGAKENLNWLKSSYPFNANFQIKNLNSLKAENKQYDAIVTESSLGEVLRKRLKGKQADKYLEDFKKHIIPLLRHFKTIKKKQAKIVITFPCFEGTEISAEEIQEKTGLNVYSSEKVEFPIIEKRKNQFVNRQIWVFY